MLFLIVQSPARSQCLPYVLIIHFLYSFISKLILDEFELKATLRFSLRHNYYVHMNRSIFHFSHFIETNHDFDTLKVVLSISYNDWPHSNDSIERNYANEKRLEIIFLLSPLMLFSSLNVHN